MHLSPSANPTQTPRLTRITAPPRTFLFAGNILGGRAARAGGNAPLSHRQ